MTLNSYWSKFELIKIDNFNNFSDSVFKTDFENIFVEINFDYEAEF
jgi:hypothetical protein